MGELSQRFIEFVMMHAQNAALFLGQIPNPKTGQGEVNLELAKMFIDQLDMIQEKTRGNLTSEEATVLRNAISNLQMAYVEVAQGSSQGSEGRAQPPGAPPESETPPQPKEPSPADVKSTAAEPAASSPSAEAETESKKKFTKSYGP